MQAFQTTIQYENQHMVRVFTAKPPTWRMILKSIRRQIKVLESKLLDDEDHDRNWLAERRLHLRAYLLVIPMSGPMESLGPLSVRILEIVIE